MYSNDKGMWVSDLGNGNYKNPVLFADYSDPDVIRTGDDFFMVASSFTYFPGMPVLHSKDLVNWKVVSYAVKSLPFKCYDLPQHGKGVWAPSIRFHDGKYWVYFATPDEGIFMANTENPFGEWSDVVLVKEAKGWIDPCPLWDDDGNAYLVHAFARSRCGIKSILDVNKMSPDGTKLLDDGIRVFDGRITQPTIEGPKFYKRNGYYYILAPAGGVRPGWQTALRSKNIYGPYEEKVVMHQGDSKITGPHQGGLVELENGENWFVHFQDLNAYGRITHLQPVQWVDDWPLMGIDTNNDFVGEPVLEYKKPSVSAKTEICVPDTSDNFTGSSLRLQWQWQAHANSDFYDLKDEMLKLYALPIPSGRPLLCDAPNVLCQLMQSPNFEVTAKIYPHFVNDGDCAGIAVTGGNYYCIRIEKSGDKLYIKQANYEYENDTSESENQTACNAVRIADSDKVYFKIKVEFEGQISFYVSYDGEEFSKIGYTVPYSVSRKSWVGGRIGLFCVNMNGNEGNGYADFEYIKFD